MADLQKILADHRPKKRVKGEIISTDDKGPMRPLISEIPDIFFDNILRDYKLTRIEIMVLIFLYRQVWCKPNLYRIYGISQLLSHTEMAKVLGVGIEDVHYSLRKLEEYDFISTVRSGQYFVRKFFTKEYDENYSQTYDDFEI